jgi:transcriptional regulator with XRE-family HTH domain
MEGEEGLSLASVVRRLRREHGGLSQEELGALIGLSKGMIAHYERGSRSMSLETVDLIIETLNLNATERMELRQAREIATVALSEGTRRQRVEDSTEIITALAQTVQRMDGRLQLLTEEVSGLREELARRKPRSTRTSLSAVPEPAPRAPRGGHRGDPQPR